jgi:hypothetical protein
MTCEKKRVTDNRRGDRTADTRGGQRKIENGERSFLEHVLSIRHY